MEPRFARLKLDANALLPSREWVRDADAPEDLLDGTADVFILDGHNPNLALRTIESIRKDPRSFAAPVFFAGKQGARFASLADGAILKPEDAVSDARTILASLQELDPDAPRTGAEFRLLGWLYTRKDRELLPVPDPATPEIYGYPLAECFMDEGTDVNLWLQNLRDQGQITQARLVDRIRACPKCGSPHLNFIDVCPNCRSIDIQSKELVHCFTCGRVSPMEEFLKEDRLSCPYCRTRLRHLGSDYDHPLESMVCADCKNHFVEPQVVASCYRCGNVSLPGELVVRSFYAWNITDEGRISARVGKMEATYALLDQLGNVSFSYFQQFLGWCMNFTRRYSDHTFTLLVLHFVNLEAIADALGSRRMNQLIDAIVSRLKELLRLTDVISRSSLGTLWFLLPQTSREQSKIVLKRVESLRELVSAEEAPPLEMKIALFSFPDDFRKDNRGDSSGAQELLFELSAKVGEH